MKIKGYKFKDGSHYPQKKVAAIAGRLKQISGRDGVLEPKAVIIDARAKSSPLHELFEWDDGKAAEQYRLEQARRLIRSVVVVYENGGRKKGPRECRAYYTTESTAVGGPYISTGRILSDAQLRKALLTEALREAEQWKARYEHLAELAGVITAIDRAIAKVKPKKKRKTKAA